MTVRGWLSLLSVIVLVGACGGATGPTADGRSPGTETSPGAESSPGAEDSPGGHTPTREAAFTGTFGGDAELEGGCAWLDTHTEGRVEPRWPDGYRVTFDPVQLSGPDGDVVAEEGDAIAVDGSIADDVMTICQVGPVLEITEVVSVHPS